MKLPRLEQILLTISNVCEFVVYYNELNEDFTRAVATQGEWETVRAVAVREGFITSEVAEIFFEGNMVFIYLV